MEGKERPHVPNQSTHPTYIMNEQCLTHFACHQTQILKGRKETYNIFITLLYTTFGKCHYYIGTNLLSRHGLDQLGIYLPA
jgi:hypothetical protein